ncbi:MAG: hydrogenase maturation protease [Actinomycetes bacterium]
MTARVLVAGIGNVFFGDDGFGVEVARRLEHTPLPEGVQVADYGIRGMHLAYALLDGFDDLVLVDALSRGEEPGTLYVLEPDLPDPDEAAEPDLGTPVVDAHSMGPDAVLALIATLTPRLGGTLPRVRVVGCEPAVVEERMGLSGPVGGAVDEAARLVHALLTGDDFAGEPPGGRDHDEVTPGQAAGHRGADGTGRPVAAGHQAVPAHQADVRAWMPAPTRDDVADITEV